MPPKAVATIACAAGRVLSGRSQSSPDFSAAFDHRFGRHVFWRLYRYPKSVVQSRPACHPAAARERIRCVRDNPSFLGWAHYTAPDRPPLLSIASAESGVFYGFVAAGGAFCISIQARTNGGKRPNSRQWRWCLAMTALRSSGIRAVDIGGSERRFWAVTGLSSYRTEHARAVVQSPLSGAGGRGR
jgi:hypothetical protein